MNKQPMNNQWTTNERTIDNQWTMNEQRLNTNLMTTYKHYSDAYKRYLRAFSLRPDARHPTDHQDAHTNQQTPPTLKQF